MFVSKEHKLQLNYESHYQSNPAKNWKERIKFNLREYYIDKTGKSKAYQCWIDFRNPTMLQKLKNLFQVDISAKFTLIPHPYLGDLGFWDVADFEITKYHQQNAKVINSDFNKVIYQGYKKLAQLESGVRQFMSLFSIKPNDHVPEKLEEIFANRQDSQGKNHLFLSRLKNDELRFLELVRKHVSVRSFDHEMTLK